MAAFSDSLTQLMTPPTDSGPTSSFEAPGLDQRIDVRVRGLLGAGHHEVKLLVVNLYVGVIPA